MCECVWLFFLFKLSSSTLENSYLCIYWIQAILMTQTLLLKRLKNNKKNYTALLPGTTKMFTVKGRALLFTVKKEKQHVACVGTCGQGPETSKQTILVIKQAKQNVRNTSPVLLALIYLKAEYILQTFP